MFTRLLERKLWPSNNEDIIDLMFFSEHIKAKYGKNNKRNSKSGATGALQ